MTLLLLSLLTAADWPAKTELRHDEEVFVTYQARLEGNQLIVQCTMAPEWHTYTMDNRLRVEEKLAGKKALAIDKPTVIEVTGGLTVEGPWQQSEPLDFSKPDLRLFAYGYEKEATFAAKAKRTGAAPAQIRVKAQVCTPSTCRMVDTTLELPANAAPAPAQTRKLIAVRAQ